MDNISFRISTTRKWYHGFCHKRTLLLGLIPISVILLSISKHSPYIAEHVFARGSYKYVSQVVNNITGIIPISLMELMIISLPIILLSFFIYIVVGCVKLKKSKNSYFRFVSREKDSISYFFTRQLNNLLCVCSVLLFGYTLLCGTNYYRYSFDKISNLTMKESSIDELYHVLDDLAKEAAYLRSELKTLGVIDETGVISYSKEELKEIGELVQKEYVVLDNKYHVFSGNYGPFKPVMLSKVMSRMEITGIYWPFTVEANVNMDASDYTIPVTIAHEMAHQRGFMREDEANFIGYLVCISSSDPRLRYSGIMLALSYGTNQLYKYNTKLYDKVISNYNEGIILDVREEYYYWRQFENTAISAFSTTMNDTYLKANNQTDGVKSYGRMIDLLLAYHRENK